MSRMEKQIRITIRLSSSTYVKLLKLAANYEGNVSMTIRKLIEKELMVGLMVNMLLLITVILLTQLVTLG